MRFPTTFAEAHMPLEKSMLDDPGVQAVRHLDSVGFNVVAGVCREDVPAIMEITTQEGVQEYCPNDSKRFGDEAKVEAWLQKDGGRGMILLKDIGDKAIMGFGWVGAGVCLELPRSQTTFAIRLHEDVAGRRQGIASAFTTAIVSGAVALYGARATGLETWASNGDAVGAYLKAGASLRRLRNDMRRTRDPAYKGMNGMRPDTRLFMEFERTF